MQVFEGIVKDRVIVLPEDVRLDEGVRVEVRVHEIEQGTSEDLYKQRLVQAAILNIAITADNFFSLHITV
jgi:hypothetical protein